jgi:hypothetical protein
MVDRSTRPATHVPNNAHNKRTRTERPALARTHARSRTRAHTIRRAAKREPSLTLPCPARCSPARLAACARATPVVTRESSALLVAAVAGASPSPSADVAGVSPETYRSGRGGPSPSAHVVCWTTPEGLQERHALSEPLLADRLGLDLCRRCSAATLRRSAATQRRSAATLRRSHTTWQHARRMRMSRPDASVRDSSANSRGAAAHRRAGGS